MAQVNAHFKGGFPDPAPVLVVGNKTVRLAEPLEWYEWIWTGFPLVLVFLGGAIGGLLGGGAAVVNTQLFRSGKPVVVKYVLSALVTIVAIGLWVFILSLIRR